MSRFHAGGKVPSAARKFPVVRRIAGGEFDPDIGAGRHQGTGLRRAQIARMGPEKTHLAKFATDRGEIAVVRGLGVQQHGHVIRHGEAQQSAKHLTVGRRNAGTDVHFTQARIAPRCQRRPRCRKDLRIAVPAAPAQRIHVRAEQGQHIARRVSQLQGRRGGHTGDDAEHDVVRAQDAGGGIGRRSPPADSSCSAGAHRRTAAPPRPPTPAAERRKKREAGAHLGAVHLRACCIGPASRRCRESV